MTLGSGTIVVGYDGSEQAKDALALGAALARTLGSQRLLVACVYAQEVVGPELFAVDDTRKSLRHDAQQRLSGVQPEAFPDLSLELRAVPATSDPRGLHDLAEQEDASIVVVGSTHHGKLGRIVIGSVGRRLLHGGPHAVAVAVAPRGFASRAPERLEAVGVAFDGSADSAGAVRDAAALGAATGARLRVITVVEPPPVGFAGSPGAFVPPDVTRHEDELVRRELDRALDSLPEEVEAEGHVLHGQPVAELLAECDRGLDLLVVGSRAYGPVRRVLLGSVSESVIRSAPCPVLVVPRGSEAAAPDLEQAETG